MLQVSSERSMRATVPGPPFSEQGTAVRRTPSLPPVVGYTSQAHIHASMHTAVCHERDCHSR